jgi:ribose/xylose/arabinose/galactoside ABC-type transport system permease subunit
MKRFRRLRPDASRARDRRGREGRHRRRRLRILPAFAAVFLGATAIRPGRINALGALIAVYFLATGTAGLELLGVRSYIQQIKG